MGDRNIFLSSIFLSHAFGEPELRWQLWTFNRDGTSLVTADDRLAEVFDRGLRDGLEFLSPTDRELFRIQDFIIEYEMGGMSSYFYNRLPDLEGILATVAAMRRHGLPELAALLAEAAELFTKYVEPAPSTTWDEILRQYDPMGRLDELHEPINALENYGLGKSSIT